MTARDDILRSCDEQGIRVKPKVLDALAGMLRDDEQVVMVRKGGLGKIAGPLVLTDHHLVCARSTLGMIDTESVKLSNVVSTKYKPASMSHLTLTLNKGRLRVVADQEMARKIQAYV